MSAMGLGGGGGGGGGSADKALDGITQPPKGKPGGRVTPDISQQLNDKKQLLANAGGGAGGGPAAAVPAGGAGGGPAAAVPAGGAPGVGGAAKAAGGAPAPGGGGHAAKSPQAPAAPTKPAAPSGGGAGANHGRGDATHGDGAGSVEAMIEELEHGHDSGARVRAAEALGKLKTPRARPALEKAARDRDPAVAAAAAKALKQVG